MSTADPNEDRTPIAQREPDCLKVQASVQDSRRTQAEAARLLGLGTRQVRRLRAEGDQAVLHRLRGRPSNHRTDPRLRGRILDAYRRHFPDFGPTPAREKLAEHGLHVALETLPVALLRSPILPPAARTIARRGRTVHPRITPGGGHF
jgi:hypothetical protein